MILLARASPAVNFVGWPLPRRFSPIRPFSFVVSVPGNCPMFMPVNVSCICTCRTDEPTSGLDSYLAESVVNMLKNLASSGRTIICTIHQPSSEVFILFDRLLLLTNGRLAFMGTLEEAQQHFASLGMICPNNFNPADYYLKLISNIPGMEVECEERINVSQRMCKCSVHLTC